ncbi:hypothetical protein [Haliangium sp. UPWRP_2]|uniref:hypothetical protein n=1 Tax=Haliangium sp. UPWRP_2 TaxID=1931276 RepID=UPI0011B2887D|nr:hypothetical protein [Haliangium sp. UPWRP_2]
MSFWENFKKLVSKWASANDAKKSGIDAGKQPVAPTGDTDKPTSDAPPMLPPPRTEQGPDLPSVHPTPGPAKSTPKQDLVPARDYTAQDTASIIGSVGNVLGNLSSVLSGYLGKLGSNTGSSSGSSGDVFTDNRGSGGEKSSTVNDSREVVD